MARLIWSPRAADNLEAILEYVEQHSPTAAAELARGLMQLIEKIPDEPMGGPMVPEIQQPEIRERLYGRKYRVVCRVKADAVEIICISHGARLLRNVLGDDFDFDVED